MSVLVYVHDVCMHMYVCIYIYICIIYKYIHDTYNHYLVNIINLYMHKHVWRSWNRCPALVLWHCASVLQVSDLTFGTREGTMTWPTLGEAHVKSHIVCFSVDHDVLCLDQTHDVINVRNL